MKLRTLINTSVMSITTLVTLTSVLLASPAYAASAITNFTTQKIYIPGNYTDISESAWYASDVASVYELGLMGGKGAGIFDANGNLTLAEALSIASRVNDIYHGGSGTLVNTGSNWYDTAVAYCVEHGIIAENDFTLYTAKATRAQMAYIFANALPITEYKDINTITSLPDVTSTTKYSDSIFTLYSAGVITGSDAKGTFKPTSNITRAEAAAIIKRVVQPDVRKKVSFETAAPTPTPTTPPVATSGYLEGFDFNGKYYPIAYWNGATEAEARATFLQDRKLKPSYVPGDGSDAMINAWLGGLQSESVYQLVVKDITARYPIIIKGTVAEISARQEQQLLALAGWLREHTYYSYERDQAPGDFNMSRIYSYNTPTMVEEIRTKLKNGHFATGVCENYAETFKSAAQLMGIDTMYVASTSGNHGWNVVRMADGRIFYFDTTSIDHSNPGLFGQLTEEAANSAPFGKYGDAKAYNQNVTTTSKRLWALVGRYIFDVDLAEMQGQLKLPAGSAYGTIDEWWSMFNAWNAEYPIRENNPMNH